MRAFLPAFAAVFLAGGARAGTLEVVSRVRTPSVAERVLDLAVADDETVVALSAEAVCLYRWSRDGLRLESRQPLPGPAAPVRVPGGLLGPLDESGAFWALTSCASAAALFRIEGRQLKAVSEADALPWTGSPEGLRFRPGTNLVDGRIASLGIGPFLAVEPGVAIARDGRLRTSDEDEDGALRAGAALASLGDGLFAVSAPQPPGSDDVLRLIERAPQGLSEVLSLPLDGAIRSLAFRPRGRALRVWAGIEGQGGESYFVVLDLSRNP
jgi:hypothetical protein